MEIKTFKTNIFLEGEDLVNFILKYIKRVPENSVIVITSKIVSLSEKRVVVNFDDKTKEDLIKKESSFAIKTKYTWLTIKDGIVMASAGIDESNAKGKLILLPEDSFASAEKIRNKLKKIYNVKNLGILITDSRTLPLRAGIVGMSLGYAGFKGIRDYRGKKDIFGRILKMSRTDIADSLSTSAVICMGEGNEMQPLALIAKPPIEFINKIKKDELFIDPREDMYQPLFEKIKKIKF